MDVRIGQTFNVVKIFAQTGNISKPTNVAKLLVEVCVEIATWCLETPWRSVEYSIEYQFSSSL